MKSVAALAIMLALGTAVLAKPTPAEPWLFMSESLNASAVFVGPAGAMMESDYFRAPSQASAQRIFPCLVRPLIFEKTQVTRTVMASCN